MARELSGVAARRRGDTSIGSFNEHSIEHSAETRGAPGVLHLPARFHGRAQFEVDLADTVETFSAALRQVARPESVTAEAVQTYCREQAIDDERMVHALLKEAFHVISREVLVERLIHAVERGLAVTPRARGGEEGEVVASELVPSGRGRTFTDHYRGTVFREGESMIVRLALGSTLEPPLAFAPGQRVRARAHQAIPVTGTLRVEGSFRSVDGSPPAQIRVHWRVRKSADTLDTRAIHSLAAPLEEVVACVGAGVLARFAEAIPDHLASLARADRGPAFVHVERLLRFGRVTQKTRAYLLYWQRLRDYLLWRVRAEMRGTR
ncbi:MAG TPA: hypothetical protein VNM90_17650 [Haliangium sp.]|nr:hypothetical protein [Haliangium sp.]